MRIPILHVAIASTLFLLPLRSHAAPISLVTPISDLFNTGVVTDNNQGTGATLVGDGLADPHWLFISGPQTPSTAPQARVQTPTPVWQANGPNSKWIGVTGNGTDNVAVGTYVLRTSFTLPGDVNVPTASLSFTAAVDNAITDIALNNQSTGISLPDGPFTLGTTYTIDKMNGHFQAGSNTLTFTTFNRDGGGGANPFGLRIGDLQGSYTLVPEPTSALWIAIGSCLLLGRRQTQRTK
jgi:hypothetical protein